MSIVIPQTYGQCIHSLRYGTDPELMAVTIGCRSTDAADSTDVDAVAARFAQAFIDNILPVMSDVVSLVQTEITFQLDALPAPPILGISTLSDDGALSTPIIPQNSAYLIHKRTSFGGRGGRGRWYIPGVTEASVDHLGNVAGATITAWTGALSGYITDVNVLGPPESVPELLHSDPGAFSATDPHPITSMTLDTLIATQRRRLRP